MTHANSSRFGAQRIHIPWLDACHVGREGNGLDVSAATAMRAHHHKTRNSTPKGDTFPRIGSRVGGPRIICLIVLRMHLQLVLLALRAVIGHNRVVDVWTT